MQPNEFLRASHDILIAVQESTDKTGSDQTDFLAHLLRGDAGRDVQQVLVEVGIALERSALASSLPRALKGIVYDFESRAFRALNTSGLYVDATKVLTERLLGVEGLAAMAKSEFAEIKANISHISKEIGEEQALYWHSRVKDFKYRAIEELKNFTRAANMTIETTADIFSAATSQTMNKLLSLKEDAEVQQDILIRVRTGAVPVGNKELEIITRQLLTDYLREAAAGSNSVLFARRLHSMVDRCLPLRVFEDAYSVLNTASARHWREVEGVAEEFRQDIKDDLLRCTEAIEAMIDVMDYADLPVVFEINFIIEPLVSTTRATSDKIKNHTNAWLQAVNDIQNELQDELHPA